MRKIFIESRSTGRVFKSMKVALLLGFALLVVATVVLLFVFFALAFAVILIPAGIVLLLAGKLLLLRKKKKRATAVSPDRQEIKEIIDVTDFKKTEELEQEKPGFNN
ncbi:MAG: hypothetical protein NTX32_03710 [Candidatus Firestonebacteria bacterium]|nr:hypothetical protein [Candidatus Firestonebacteria bacterium]